MTLSENSIYTPSENVIDNRDDNRDNPQLITKNTKRDEKTKRFLSLLIDERLSYSDAEKQCGYQKGAAKVKVARLKKQGFVEIKDDKLYFTEKGNKLYRGVERVITGQEQIVDIHFHKIKAKILNKGLISNSMNFLDKVELIIQVKQMQFGMDYSTCGLKNTKIYIFHKLYGTEIRATSEHILIGIPKSLSMNVDSCLKDTEIFFKDILPKLEKFFGIKLDNHFINQFWLSSRHIEYINHKLALLHKKYECMDIEVLDNDTGERLLYFDKSGGTTNAETESRNKGVEVSYALEQLDRDLTQGKSLREVYDMNYNLKLDTEVTFGDIKQILVQSATQLAQTTVLLQEREKVNSVLDANIMAHIALLRDYTNRITKEQDREIQKLRQTAGQCRLDKYMN